MHVPYALEAGEALDLEFKRQVTDRELYEAVVCMANALGGTILVGVDNDGTVVGAAPRHGDHTDTAKLTAAIQNNIDPPLAVQVDLHETPEGSVIAVRVPQADPGPAGTKSGLYVKRVIGGDGKPACVPVTPAELVSRAQITRGIDPALAPLVGATWADLDPLEFDRFRRMCRNAGSETHLVDLSNEDICMALGLVPRGHEISVGMVLLFGTPEAIRRHIPTAEVLFHDSRDSWSANEQFHSPLLAVAERLDELLQVRDVTTEVTVGIQRMDIPLLGQTVRRESIANALVHRDYSVLGPISVQLSTTEFKVVSPGGLPPGVTIGNILEQSRPRSLVLADALRRAGLVERRGKGVNEMFESQLRAGRDVPSYEGTSMESVVLTVPLATVDLDVVRYLAAVQTTQQRSLGLDELRTAYEIKVGGPVQTSELADRLGIPIHTARAVLQSLVEDGVLEVHGSGRGRRFQLTARFYDLAQDQAAYVRVKPLDSLQQEQMVLDYATTYGRVTRSLVAALCRIPPTEATRLLRGLVDAGKLELRGEKRGAHYVVPEGLGE